MATSTRVTSNGDEVIITISMADIDAFIDSLCILDEMIKGRAIADRDVISIVHDLGTKIRDVI